MKNLIQCLAFVWLSLSTIHATTAHLHYEKGPRGLHVLTEHYVLVADDNIDAISVVDIQEGGVVGIVRLHAQAHDPPSPDVGIAFGNQHHFYQEHEWFGALDVATCLDCDFMYVIGHFLNHITRVQLPVAWKGMVESHDFSPLREVNGNPINIMSLEQDTGEFVHSKQVVMTSDGQHAFFVQWKSGLWRINSKGEPSLYMQHHEMGLDFMLEGIHMSLDDKHLIVNSRDRVATVNIESKDVSLEQTFSEGICNADGGSFWNLILSHDGRHAYGFAHNKDVVNTGGALYKFLLEPAKRDPTVPRWCRRLAGNQDEPMGWIDGDGEVARFATRHGAEGVGLLPNSPDGVERLITTDVFNQALRLITIVDSDNVQVSTIPYNEDLWFKAFFDEPMSPPEVPMTALSVPSETSWEKAHATCHKKGMRVCAAEEIRSQVQPLMEQGELRDSLSPDTVTMWTGTSCSACYIKKPGFCPTLEARQKEIGQENVDVVDNRDEYFFGSQHFMTAQIMETKHNGKSRYHIENQCLDTSTQLSVDDMHVMCCPSDEDSSSKLHKILLGLGIPLLVLAVAALSYLYRANIAAGCLSLSFLCSNWFNKRNDQSHNQHKRVTKKLVENALARQGNNRNDASNQNIRLVSDSELGDQLDPDGSSIWSDNKRKKDRSRVTLV